MKKNIVLWIAGIIIVGIMFVSGLQLGSTGNQAAITGKSVAQSAGNSAAYQEVTLSFENYRYKVSPETLTVGVPVKMTVDLTSVSGCMRDVVIPAFGVRKYVRAGDTVIEFTPNKAGTFPIICSMNMGRGSFEVVEPDGSASDFVEDVPEEFAGATCGSGGSCGCGG
ncbi:MAG: cupredoxin domain-containing protein [Candidatus Woesearchaeota archaeon]|nr:MAG: cupredoxin domain-containing protein [Candidatus Woesearchaeota archaeon]